MNYQKLYDNIINNAKSQNRIKLKRDNPNYVYYENHHIIPKCLNGSDDKNNLVLLTAREHFICHKLLTFIYPHNRGLILSLHRMIYSNQLGNIFSSKDYQYIKEIISNVPMSNETKQKIRKKAIGRKASDETKQKISISQSNKIISDETKQKISLIKKGKKRKPFSNLHKKHMRDSKLGKKRKAFSNLHKKHMGEAQLGKKKTKESIKKYIKTRIKNSKKCPYCNKIIEINNYMRWHGDKCKYKNDIL